MATVVMPQQDVSALSTSDITMKINCSIPASPTDSGVGSTKCTPTADAVLFPGLETCREDDDMNARHREEVMSLPATIAHNDSQNCNVVAKPVITNGPDVVAPADSYMTWLRDAPVKLRMEETGPRSEKPISLPTMLLNTSRQHASRIALASKKTGEWVTWSYRDYYEDVRMAAKAFIYLGLEPHNSVGIIGFNAPEWSIANCAAIFAGGCSTGIYTTNSPEACRYVLEDSQSNIAVVENDQQLQKVLQVWDTLPLLKAVVQYTGKLKEKHANVYEWSQLRDFAKKVDDNDLEQRLRSQAVNHCCALIYTSGTTGNPKGVMLSHDNVTWSARMNARAGRVRMAEEVLISYLPLSHVAAQVVDIYIPIATAGSVYFAQPDALKGSLTTTLKDVRPTQFLGVPRVWEKIAEKMKEIGKGTTGLKKRIATWAKDVGYRGNISLQKGGSLPFGWTLANALVFKKVKAALGLDRCRMCLSGAAPIMKETLTYFLSLNIVITDNYGMSESTGPHTVSFPWKYRTTSIGVDFPGSYTHLDNMDDEGNGEICMAGRHVFMGYVDNEAETVKVIDEDGRLHSGDIGRKDEDGFLYITGRIKEILITAGGENVAPVLIEDVVKEELPCVSNCMLIGDKKKFLSMLITFKTIVDPDTLVPQDELAPMAADWCRSVGSSAKTVADILDNRDERVLAAVQAGVERANERAISRAQKIQKWSLLPHDFSVPGGELGPTMKLKRPVVVKKYEKTIDALYDV